MPSIPSPIDCFHRRGTIEEWRPQFCRGSMPCACAIPSISLRWRSLSDGPVMSLAVLLSPSSFDSTDHGFSWGRLSPHTPATGSRRVRREGSAISRAAGVSAPSKDVLDRTRGHYRLELNDAAVIPCPVSQCLPEMQWKLATCDRNRVLFIGRFDGHKGGDSILEAFAHVAMRKPLAALTFVGPDSGFIDGEGKRWQIAEYIEHRFGNSPTRSRVEYLGFQKPEEIAHHRRNAMVTVVCSRYETFAMTAAEAMAAGCPIVATDTGALPELIQHERNGLLCQPNDSFALAEKILQMLNHPERAAALGEQAARDAGSRYHPRTIARQTLEFYGEVLKRSGGIGQSR